MGRTRAAIRHCVAGSRHPRALKATQAERSFGCQAWFRLSFRKCSSSDKRMVNPNVANAVHNPIFNADIFSPKKRAAISPLAATRSPMPLAVRITRTSFRLRGSLTKLARDIFVGLLVVLLSAMICSFLGFIWRYWHHHFRNDQFF